MSVSQITTRLTHIDLRQPPVFVEDVPRILRYGVDPAFGRAVDALGDSESPGSRARRVIASMHTLNSWEATHFLLAAAKGALRRDPAGTRVLLSVFSVRPPGVEVLRSLQRLSSLERVTLQLIGGRWRDEEESVDENPVFPILELLCEATELGILDLGIESLPRRPDAAQAVVAHLRRWFSWLTDRLAKGGTLPDRFLQFLIQFCMLEIALIEKRISRLAESIDPYDARGMARLMPVLSRYDQDIEHMKGVIGQVVTYRPFHERALSLEGSLDSREVDRLQREMEQHPAAAPLAAILGGIRANPILDRHLASLVSMVHQLAAVRGRLRGNEPPPDLLSTMHEVIRAYREGFPLRIRMEPEIAGEIWPVAYTWGTARQAHDGIRLRLREERVTAFVAPDGTPLLPEDPQPLDGPELSIEELVRMQMGNEPFILGVLDNSKITSRSRVVPILATLSRSLRVLEKIARVRALYTGPTNKDVPRLLLLNPTRIPISSLRRLIHVRFIAKRDLENIARQRSGVRREVQHEIGVYLKSISS